jgi:uncharacterized protein YkwD
MSTAKGIDFPRVAGVLAGAILTGSTLVGLVAAPAAAAGTDRTTAAHDDVVRLTTAERQKAGCPPLRVVPELDRSAQGHTDDMAAHNFMGHAGSDGSSMTARAVHAGYSGWRSLAENVAAGYPTADAVVAGWMNSSGHRANILNCKLKDIGVGHAANANTAYGTFWTQDFGLR